MREQRCEDRYNAVSSIIIGQVLVDRWYEIVGSDTQHKAGPGASSSGQISNYLASAEPEAAQLDGAL